MMQCLSTCELTGNKSFVQAAAAGGGLVEGRGGVNKG